MFAITDCAMSETPDGQSQLADISLSSWRLELSCAWILTAEMAGDHWAPPCGFYPRPLHLFEPKVVSIPTGRLRSLTISVWANKVEAERFLELCVGNHPLPYSPWVSADSGRGKENSRKASDLTPGVLLEIQKCHPSECPTQSLVIIRLIASSRGQIYVHELIMTIILLS